MTERFGFVAVLLVLVGSIALGTFASQVRGLALSPRDFVVDLSSELSPPSLVYLSVIGLKTSGDYPWDSRQSHKEVNYTRQTLFRQGDIFSLPVTYDYLFDEARERVFRSMSGITLFDRENVTFKTWFWHNPPEVSILKPCPSTHCVRSLNFTELGIPSAELVLQIEILDPEGRGSDGFSVLRGGGGSGGSEHQVDGRVVTEKRQRLQFEIAPDLSPGVYVIRVMVTDLVTGMTSSLSVEIVVEGI
jgi:hypothetical protein